MKRIKYILLFVAILGFTGCDILDLKPLDKLSDKDVWEDPILIQIYVNGCYNSVNHGYRQDMMIGLCDEGYNIHGSGGSERVQKGEITADNMNSISGLLNYWKTGYDAIRKINVFFENIESAPVDESLKKSTIAEMKFIRAFVYSNLIWRYGGVPIITKAYGMNEDYTVKRGTYDECVDFIVKELNDAMTGLPDKQPDSAKGRASADACRALKARVLLYAASPLVNTANEKSKWQAAADAAKELIDTRYTLHTDYRKIFLEDNNEVIFARYFTQSNSANHVSLQMGRNGDGGWGAQNPSQGLVDDYEIKSTGLKPYTRQSDGTYVLNTASGYSEQDPYTDRDPRFYASIIHDGMVWMNRETESYTNGADSPESASEGWNASRTTYYLKKFLQEEIPPTGSSEQPTSTWVFFRYAEILLNYAEAMFEVGEEDTARQYLNMVRSRPGINMPNVPTTETGDALRARIHNERRVELAFEEHRFFDIRRWKIAEQTEKEPIKAMRIIKNADNTKAYTTYILRDRDFQPQHYWLPISRDEIDKSLNCLEQNPGYK